MAKIETLPDFTLLDIVAIKEGHEPVIKEMTYGDWKKFKAPNNGWKYSAFQKGFEQFSYIIKKRQI